MGLLNDEDMNKVRISGLERRFSEENFSLIRHLNPWVHPVNLSNEIMLNLNRIR